MIAKTSRTRTRLKLIGRCFSRTRRNWHMHCNFHKIDSTALKKSESKLLDAPKSNWIKKHTKTLFNIFHMIPLNAFLCFRVSFQYVIMFSWLCFVVLFEFGASTLKTETKINYRRTRNVKLLMMLISAVTIVTPLTVMTFSSKNVNWKIACTKKKHR